MLDGVRMRFLAWEPAWRQAWGKRHTGCMLTGGLGGERDKSWEDTILEKEELESDTGGMGEPMMVFREELIMVIATSEVCDFL